MANTNAKKPRFRRSVNEPLVLNHLEAKNLKTRTLRVGIICLQKQGDCFTK